MRVRLFVEVEIRDALMWGEGGPDADALAWFERDVLGSASLHSNEIGDEVGPLRVLAMDRPRSKPTPVPKTMKRLRRRDVGHALRGGQKGER